LADHWPLGGSVLCGLRAKFESTVSEQKLMMMMFHDMSRMMMMMMIMMMMMMMHL
jgi:hypothetical protein